MVHSVKGEEFAAAPSAPEVNAVHGGLQQLVPQSSHNKIRTY
jgi:hypothetical protein